MVRKKVMYKKTCGQWCWHCSLGGKGAVGFQVKRDHLQTIRPQREDCNLIVVVVVAVAVAAVAVMLMVVVEESVA